MEYHIRWQLKQLPEVLILYSFDQLRRSPVKNTTFHIEVYKFISFDIETCGSEACQRRKSFRSSTRSPKGLLFKQKWSVYLQQTK